MQTKSSIEQRLKQRIDLWLSRRLPAAKQVTLTHKTIFILPTGFGFCWLLLIGTLFVFGTNYQNNLVMGLSFLLLSIFNTCIIYSYKNLAGLTLRHHESTSNTFAGQACYIPIQMSSNRDAFEIQLNFDANAPQTIRKVTTQADIVSVATQSSQRGTLKPGRVKVESRFPLGLCRVWSHIDLAISQVIYPNPINNQHQLSSQPLDANHNQVASQFIAGVDEFNQLKPYIVGEPIKHIAWKQWAQGRGMLTKEFQQPQGAPLWLTVDDEQQLELQLSYLCWQTLQLSQQQQTFGLSIGGLTISPSNGEQHKINVLTHLALFKPQNNANTGILN
ncbi:DUF58 domain-containing protein [Shewanella youngdeokensis]|uniref:DUF58 domain-containing protein n=1 Tax=Shewanella youngdeokensis TaxID=2999068 RepID=A0ABZ0JW08_9GAMM|nr:DUF58 domain-containing protein [Shewanella sp. DAU334]